MRTEQRTPQRVKGASPSTVSPQGVLGLREVGDTSGQGQWVWGRDWRWITHRGWFGNSKTEWGPCGERAGVRKLGDEKEAQPEGIQIASGARIWVDLHTCPGCVPDVSLRSGSSEIPGATSTLPAQALVSGAHSP